MWGRFKDPAQYLHERKETELWLRKEFILKGGRPQHRVYGSATLHTNSFAKPGLAKANELISRTMDIC